MGVNGLVTFMSKVNLAHPRLRGSNLVTRCVLIEVSCVNPNKTSYVGDEAWSKALKVLDPRIRKMKAEKFFVSLLIYSIYI